MDIITFTGFNVYYTIKIKLTIKEKRKISIKSFHNNHKKTNIVFNILNKKVSLINSHFRNYIIRKINKLKNIYKKVYFIKNVNNYICNDLIYKIFNYNNLLRK